jgi:molybdate transport repressor ModE-like protein
MPVRGMNDIRPSVTSGRWLDMANRQLRRSWDDFQYFLAVARTGTLAAAATHLGTEHTTVARHVRTLEEQFSTTLFHRRNSGYVLTEAGQRLIVTAETIESAVISARSTVEGEGPISGTVRIGAPDAFGTVFLAPRLAELVRQHPQLEIEIQATARSFSLSKREADIAIALSVPEQMRLVTRRLTDYFLFVYASRTYLDKSEPIKSVADLRSHSLIGYVEELVFAPELNYLSVIADDAQARIRSTTTLGQIHATLGGAGLCILPGFIGPTYPSLVAVLPEQISLKRAFYMHIHEDHRNASQVQAVASFIASEVKRNSGLFHSH